jgi:hypothetical protein
VEIVFEPHLALWLNKGEEKYCHMTDVNVQLVREFFDLNGFHSMTYWQHDRERARADHGLQLFVENTAPASARDLDLVLRPGDAAFLRRAIVEVRPWHNDKLYASAIDANQVLFEVAGPESMARGEQVFGTRDFKTVLVISELPATIEARERSLDCFRQTAINHIIEFPVILHEILDTISPWVSYAPSQTLQTLRLLKRYDLIRFQQLEFAFHNEAPIVASGLQMDLVQAPEPAITESAGDEEPE